MSALASYDQLPAAPRGGRSAWGVFDSDAAGDLGSIALQTPERIARAGRLVTAGKLFALNAPVAAFAHEAWGRKLPEHELVHETGTMFFDDLLHNYALQGSSQWDSLAHVGYGPGVFYDGATEDDISTGRRNSIDHWARKGIAGRGVLLDLVALRASQGRDYRASSEEVFTPDDLEEARSRAGLTFETGDILILHTGFASYFAGLSVAERTAGVPSPGLEHSEAMCRYLWNNHFSAVVSDNQSVEAWPADMSDAAFPFGALHNMLIGQLGFALGELWDLDALAADCAADSVYEMFIVSAPINLPGGIGSPANVVAIK